MLEKVLRSPFMMMVMLIMFGVVYVGAGEGWPLRVFYIPFFSFFLLYFLLIVFHNKRHPEKKIKVFTLIPYELREDDEGLQYITFKAMRKVYIFYYFAIPFGIAMAFIFQHIIPYFTIWLLVTFGIVQYFIYWLEIRKAFTEED